MFKLSVPRILAVFLLGLSVQPAVAGAEYEDPFDRLETLEEEMGAPEAPKNKAERAQIKRALRTPVRRLIRPSTRSRREQRAYVPLKGSVQHYVARIVNGKANRRALKNIKTGFVPCVSSEGRCVAIVGDSCASFGSDECEGMHFIVVLRPESKKFSLDRAIAGGYYLTKTQDDVQDMLREAP